MLHHLSAGRLTGLLLVAVTLAGAAGPPVRAADTGVPADPAAVEAEARRLIKQRCVLCHPALPDGGWVQMTQVRRDRAGWESELHRMEEDYHSVLTPEETAILVDYFATRWGPEPE
ncbi:hypothetical protein [Roseospira goensis]|uniref:Mono/diheme cytochrome c family protein n=1 Tax=Roseospira goensis TaxID=391922 RepID=A0A7W6WMP6_9PROT|nr:hypothetical protein [Roseospira goensis]MBB4287717.1 mono/diheme cytochrome c family protein [Roseospira goensis]